MFQNKTKYKEININSWVWGSKSKMSIQFHSLFYFASFFHTTTIHFAHIKVIFTFTTREPGS